MTLIKTSFFVITIILISPSISYCQEEKKVKRHKVEILYPTFHFFDGTPIIFRQQNPSSRIIPSKRGISYTYFLKNRIGFQVFNISFGLGYPSTKETPWLPGDIVEKSTRLYGGYFLYPLLKKEDNNTFWLNGGITYRRGYEGYYEYTYHWPHYGYNSLKDLGASLGFQWNKQLWWKFTAGISGSYTYFLYLHHKKEPISATYFPDPGVSRHLIDLTLRLGCRF